MITVNPDPAVPRDIASSAVRATNAPARLLALLPGVRRERVEVVLGHPIRWCTSTSEFLDALDEGRWHVLLLALDGDRADEALARRVYEQSDGAALFLISPGHTVERVLAAERAGAIALLPDPPDEATLAREVLPILTEPVAVPLGPAPAAREGAVVGSSPALLSVYRVIARAAATPAPVLIRGESGTGKELVAHALHDQGHGGPFVPVNCAAIPDTLLEAELFGFERGAFTGAVTASNGRFGRAHGGTLFLDEIGEMSLSLQAKLLRVIETGEVERLGSREPVRVEVRIVAATNRDLRERVRAGGFREDLLFRLAVVEVELPPLRERPDDLEPLAHHFTSRFSAAYGKEIRGFSRGAWDRLREHAWPGNVRELRNTLDRAVILARAGVVRSADLQLGEEAPRTSPAGGAGGVGYPPTVSLREVEARHIRKVLRHTGGHMGEAARILGIHRNTMTAKVREYGIDVSSFPSGS